MTTELIHHLLNHYKETYNGEIGDAVGLFTMEKNILEFLMELGRSLEAKLFEEIGNGYRGRTIEQEGETYIFKGYRNKTLQTLFGAIDYERAYYVKEAGQGTLVPVDRMLGVQKRHTPGFQYFVALFTGNDAYGEGLKRFREIFRPAGNDTTSLRKALDMNYDLGEKLERLRKQELQDIGDGKGIEQEKVLEDMAISIDATKVREKEGEQVGPDGNRTFTIGFRDAKIAAVAGIGWDEKRQEAVSEDISYVSSIEHADEFFPRIWAEMNRRGKALGKNRLIFLGDGATWIWDRISELRVGETCIEVLDYYHACENLSDLCKDLFGEQTEEYHLQFRRWKDLFYRGKVLKVIKELKLLRGSYASSKGEALQKKIDYFENNAERMRYSLFRKMKIPIGSGTVESACKNVIGGRMKQGGMTWSDHGAKGMLQIRASLKSDRFHQDFLKILKAAA